ncbi:aromatic ring-hydroxylating dioxygenase subunit alpha [Sphingobium sp. 10 DY56-G10]|jgi:phenylpropionate dioxygenase-like ring-hydroxylating dioxygenase large terminal subunit|uniref:aromatic ring-hydroxylating oxygenase subunit alpha n=1 Tax=Sphingobium sp. 10 DY56-G10 TaxID=2974918 RepID=UPI00352A1F3A
MTLETPERIQSMWEAASTQMRERRHPDDFPALPDIPAARYTSEAFYELEKKHLWSRTWLFVGLAHEFEEQGSYRTYTLNEAPVVVMRGRDGEIRAFHNVCQHRGSLLMKDEGGVARNMRCLYHCWTYDLDGKLIFVPDEHYFSGLNKEERGLKPIRCEQFGSLLFVNFDEQAAPLVEYLTDIPALWSDIPLDDLRLFDRFSFEVDCNWKCLQDNFAENYHAKYVHENTIDKVIDSKTSALQMLRGGHNAIVIKSRGTLTSGMGAAFFKSEDDSAEDQASKLAEISRSGQRSYNIFPNGTFPIAEYLFPIVMVWPIDAGRCKVEVSFVKTGDGPANEKLDADTLTFFKSFIGEDLDALAGMHKALAHGGIDSIPLCWSEQFIYNHEQHIDVVMGRENVPQELAVVAVDLPYAHA